jgi:hypothetical protein
MCIYPVILIVFAFLVIVFVAKTKMHKYIKRALIVLATLNIVLAFLILFLFPIFIATQKQMELGALGFVHNTISDLRSGKVPPLAADINASNANDIISLANHLPSGDYRVELLGQTTTSHYGFCVRFPPDQCFECEVEPYETDRVRVSLLIRTGYKLYLFKRTDCVEMRSEGVQH